MIDQSISNTTQEAVSNDSHFFLGFDVSTQSLKAQLIDHRGRRVSSCTVVYHTALSSYQTDHGVLHGANKEATAPIAMYLEALDMVFAHMQKEGWLMERIAGISVAAQQHATIYCRESMGAALASLDKTPNLRSLVDHLSRTVAPLWLDDSTGDDIDRMEKELSDMGCGGDYVAATSGSPFATRFPAAQISKFHRDSPAEYHDTTNIHLLSSFMTSVLIGRHAPVDPGDGAGANLLDLSTGTWDGRLCDVCAPGVLSKLPPVAPAAGRVGWVSSYFTRYGLTPTCRVLVGTGDNPAAVIGSGAACSGRVVVSLGTSDTVFSAAPPPPTGQPALGHTFGHPAGGWLWLACFKNGSLAREAARAATGQTWAEASQSLMGAAHDPTLPVIQPFILCDEITPPHPATPLPDGLGRAALPALCLAQIRHIKSTASGRLGSPSTIILTGGGSQNDGLTQLIADVFNCPVIRQDTPGSAAYGAALRAWQAGCGVGWCVVDGVSAGERVTLPRGE